MAELNNVTARIDDSWDGKGTLIVITKNGVDYTRIFHEFRMSVLVTDEDGLILYDAKEDELAKAIKDYHDGEL